MMAQKQLEFRQTYRARVAGWYNGHVHVLVIYTIGLMAIYLYTRHIDNVAVDDPPIAYAADQQLEHFAFAANGLADFLAHLRAEKVAYYCRVLPTTETRQINFHDCDGNHLHVDFPASETADLANYDGS